MFIIFIKVFVKILVDNLNLEIECKFEFLDVLVNESECVFWFIN